mmetsp:Transcript_17000/g.26204  ORF Transcript_17000/g.26204 Transcript_17000/m.26204 type:complete len:89 (-) Transcript_17000:1384-1650(-)
MEKTRQQQTHTANFENIEKGQNETNDDLLESPAVLVSNLTRIQSPIQIQQFSIKERTKGKAPPVSEQRFAKTHTASFVKKGHPRYAGK